MKKSSTPVRSKVAVASELLDEPLSEYDQWVASWSLMHSDAYHGGDRSTCEHCQEMIKAFGEMPPADDIERVSSLLLKALNKGRYRKKSIPSGLRKRVFERDAYRCCSCGDWHDLTVDHVVAESKGGTAELDNLQTLCRSCNCRKGVS